MAGICRAVGGFLVSVGAAGFVGGAYLCHEPKKSKSDNPGGPAVSVGGAVIMSGSVLAVLAGGGVNSRFKSCT